MSYTDFFGGQTLPPSETSYSSLNITVDQTLLWPWESDIATGTLSKVTKVTCSSALSITLPNAKNCSVGEDFMIYNVGAYTLTIKKADGSTLATITSGQTMYFVVSDNTTTAGQFDFFVFGAGSSSATAGALIGYGVKAIGATLNQSHPVASAASAITIDATHRAKLVSFTGGAATFPLTAVATLGDDFFTMIRNSGSGTLTLDPNGSELIDGSSTLQVQPGESLFLVCSGAAWYSVGYGRSVLYQFTQLTKDVSAGGTITLTASEAANKLITFTGNPAANLNVVIPAVVAIYYLSSAISTARQITFKTASGTGVTIAQNSNMIVLCDGTNVLVAQSANSNTSVSLSDGSALLPALFFASQTNSGLFKSSTYGLGFAVNGTLVVDIQSTGTAFVGTSPIVSAKIGPTTAQQHAVPAVTSDTIALLAATQTLTNKTLTSPTINSPSGITKGDVGLGNVDNTSDATKNSAAVTLTNKTFTLGANSFSGTLAQFNTACADYDFASLTGSETLTNKTMALGSNTISGTMAQFNTACTDGDFGYLAALQTWSASQRGTQTTDNDLSFDLNVTNNFFCTPTAGATLTFTNLVAGQAGTVILVNGSNYAIAKAASVKVDSSFLTTVSTSGTYRLSYYCDGTNVYVTTSQALS